MPSALITGITGQDGSYLTELLLTKGYTVHGLVRRTSNTVRSRLDPLFHDKDVYNKRLFLHYADLDDATTIRRVLVKTNPDELYHLAGQSHVGASFEIPESTCQFTAMGTLKLLEIIRDLEKQPRLLHISSSEDLRSPRSHHPKTNKPRCDRSHRTVSPKRLRQTWSSVYRDSFGLFACNAICYNHESPRRGESFVTRKITKAAAAISKGRQDRLMLGSLDGRRDWGYAPEYVDAMWRTLQHDKPEDFVLATGSSHTVKDFLAAAFEAVNLNWEDYVKHDAGQMRPAEVSRLVGDATKAKQTLGWEAKTRLPELAKQMVKADLEAIPVAQVVKTVGKHVANPARIPQPCSHAPRGNTNYTAPRCHRPSAERTDCIPTRSAGPRTNT